MLTRACVALFLLLTFTVGQVGAAEPAELSSLRTKAGRGNAIAQYNLGLAYVEGRQVPVDLPEAFAWLTLAAENGSTGRALNALVDTIQESELAEGRKRLEQYRAVIASGGRSLPVPRPPVRQNATRSGDSTTAGPGTVASSVQVPATTTRPPDPVASVNPGESAASELASLREDRREMSEELAGAWKENGQLRQDLLALQTALAEVRTRLAEQAAESADPAEIARLSAALAAARQEGEVAKTAAASSATKLAAAEASVSTSNNENIRLTAERDTANAARTKAGSDADAQVREITVLREKLQTAERAVAESTQNLAQVPAVKAQLAAAESARLALAADKAAADDLATRLAAEKAVLATRLEQVAAEASAHEARNKNLASELQSARENSAATVAAAARDATEAQRLKIAAITESQEKKISELNERLAAAASAASSADETKAALRRAEFSAKESSSQIAALKARVQSLEAARVAAIAEKTQAAERATKLAEQLEVAPKEAEAAQVRAATAAAEVGRLTSQRDAAETARVQAVATAASQASEIGELKQRLESASAAATAGSEARAVVATTQAQFAELQGQREALAAKLAASEAARADLAARYAAAADAAKVSAEQTAALRAEIQSLDTGHRQVATNQEALAAQLASAGAAAAGSVREAEALKSQLAAATAELDDSRRQADQFREQFAASETVRRDFGGELISTRAKLKGMEEALEFSRKETARLAEENSQLKTRVPISSQGSVDTLRAQLTVAESRAVNAENANRALGDEIARLKAARSNISPSAGGAVLTPVANAAPSRPAGNVPTGVNPPARLDVAPVTAAPNRSAPRTHLIVAGDTLSSISTKYYGTPSRWPEILAANRDVLRDERALVLGRTLRIP